MEREEFLNRGARITAEQLTIIMGNGWKIHSVFNAGGGKLHGTDEYLWVRGEDYTGHSGLFLIRVIDGGKGLEYIETVFPPKPGAFAYEDPRVVFVPELSSYVMAYVTWRRHIGPMVSLMVISEDFSEQRNIGDAVFIGKADDFGKENKNASLLPSKVMMDGKLRWALIHRPIVDGTPKMFISFCPDDKLLYWDLHRELAIPGGGSWWDADRIGLSSPPMIISPELSKGLPDGFLVIYHGVKNNTGGGIYHHGLMWLSTEGDEPRITHRSKEWIIGPDEELRGDVHSVVFICSSWIEGDRIIVWAGQNDFMLERLSIDLPKALELLVKSPCAGPGRGSIY